MEENNNQHITTKDLEVGILYWIVTIALAALVVMERYIEPQYLEYAPAYVVSLIAVFVGGVPVALWLRYTWNKIFTVLFGVNRVNFALSFLLSLILTVLLGA